eukprot:SAG11_NODE_863_length_6839_cov_4.857418_4_plen_146_part_00
MGENSQGHVTDDRDQSPEVRREPKTTVRDRVGVEVIRRGILWVGIMPGPRACRCAAFETEWNRTRMRRAFAGLTETSGTTAQVRNTKQMQPRITPRETPKGLRQTPSFTICDLPVRTQMHSKPCQQNLRDKTHSKGTSKVHSCGR